MPVAGRYTVERDVIAARSGTSWLQYLAEAHRSPGPVRWSRTALHWD